MFFPSPFCCGNADVMAGATAVTLGHLEESSAEDGKMQAGSSGAHLGPRSHHTLWEGVCSSSVPCPGGSTGWEGWRVCVCVCVCVCGMIRPREMAADRFHGPLLCLAAPGKGLINSTRVPSHPWDLLALGNITPSPASTQDARRCLCGL